MIRSIVAFACLFSLVVLPTSHAWASSTTLSYTGSATTFTVPANVYSLSVSMQGGGGGSGGSDGNAGGVGGTFTGTIAGTISVTPGQVINVAVGSGGGTGASNVAGSGGGSPGTNPTSAYNGGTGGNAGNSGTSGSGGGGGAATVIQVNSINVIAGGGGGAGGGDNSTSVAGNSNVQNPTSGSYTTGTTGQNGYQPPGDGGGSGAGGGGAVGGAAGSASGHGPANSSEYVGYGGNAGSSSTGGISGLSASTASVSAGANGFITFTYTALIAQSALTLANGNGNYGTNYALNASGGSGTGAITYTYVSGPCTVTGSSITPNGTGTCVVNATKAADSTYLSTTSSNASIVFANGLSTLTLNIVNAALIYRTASNITAITNVTGKVDFKVNGKFIPNCRNLKATSGNAFTITCPYKPAIQAPVVVNAIFTPVDTGFAGVITSTSVLLVQRRASLR
jgi:hypothetical protein